MKRYDALRKNKNFYMGIIFTVLEGLLSGCNSMVLYTIMLMLYNKSLELPIVLTVTAILGGIYLLRLFIYSFGYTQGQIGGAAVSKQIRLFLGDKLKKIPLSCFTQRQTGQYINTITSDVSNYEKILTHKTGDLAKNISLSFMLIIFVCFIWLPAGLIMLCTDLLLIPAVWLSFQAVKKYGNKKIK